MSVIELYVNHSLVAGDRGMEWNISTEEVLGGTGRATLTVQDRTNAWEPKAHWDIKVIVASSGFILWRGEIISEPVELPVAMPFRKWVLDCADYNQEMPQRLVGAFDGVTWEDADGLGDYVNVDPFANSLRTDRKTVKRLFDHYMRVDGDAIGTDTFVGEYLTDFATIFWSYTDVQKALEDMAAQIVENLQFWIDPDLEFHWTAIPAWQDLLQDQVTVAGDDTASHLAGMMPEGVPQDFQAGPAEISDVAGPGTIGGRELRFTYDGSDMPQQLYVRGSTGFVYNAGSVDPAGLVTRIDPTGYGSKASETFQLTFNTSTRIYTQLKSGARDGWLDTTFEHLGPSGPYDVEFVYVPWDPDDHINHLPGGHFWKMKTGPKKGWLVDNDTNYFNYGDITVEKLTAVVKPPSIGVGGTGWVKNATQDPNKRQAYLEAPISASQKTRDAVGGQVLYRAKFPTLRGSIKVSGTDGWRVGQVVKITDARLPDALNGLYFIIQRVQTTLIPGRNIREYVLDWGDGPTSRWSMNAKTHRGGKLQDPAIQILISTFDLSPGPNSTQTIVGQLANRMGGPWKIPGKVVKWSLEAYTNTGVKVNEGSISPKVSITDAHGRARTRLTTGSEPGRVYFVFADVAAN